MDNKKIKKLIQNYDTAELQELILAIVSKNPSAQQALLKYCQKKGKTLKPEDYAPVIINHLENHWIRASEILDEFNEYGGGPEEEEEIACDELEKMTELLETEEIPWEPRKELLEEVLDFIRMDNSGFSDMLTDVVRSMCRTKEEKIYLADLLSQSKGYYGNWASEIYRACGEDKNTWRAKRRTCATPGTIWSWPDTMRSIETANRRCRLSRKASKSWTGGWMKSTSTFSDIM